MKIFTASNVIVYGPDELLNWGAHFGLEDGGIIPHATCPVCSTKLPSSEYLIKMIDNYMYHTPYATIPLIDKILYSTTLRTRRQIELCTLICEHLYEFHEYEYFTGLVQGDIACIEWESKPINRR